MHWSLIQANLIVDFLFGLREVDDKKLRQSKRKDSKYSEGGDFKNVTPTRRKDQGLRILMRIPSINPM